MYKYTVAILLTSVLLLSTCSMVNPFWDVIEIDLERNCQVNAIQGIGNQIIFGGMVTQNGTMMHNAHPYLRMSFDRGVTWRRWTDFDFDYVDKLHYNSNTLIIRGVGIERQSIFYRCDLTSNTFEKLSLPESKSSLIQIVDRNIYLFEVLKNQFGQTYLKTIDGGKAWEEHTVLMPNKKDLFSAKFISVDKMWGIRAHRSNGKDSSDFQTLVSVDINTWNLVDEIPLGETSRNEKGYPINTHWIADIKAFKGDIYLLGKDQVKNNRGYIWKVDIVNKQIVIHDSFDLKEQDIPSDLFFYEETTIIKYTSIASVLPRQILLYKHSGDNAWKKENFPDLTLPTISFNEGKLMGVSSSNKIYFKQF